jgi:hypothetical protein
MSNQADSNNKTAGGNADQKDVPQMLKKVWNFLFLGRAAFWTAIFTGVLTVFTYQLSKVADNANDVTKETQRAFLSFSGISPIVTLTGSDGKRIAAEVAVRWNNSGTTPAEEAITRVNAQLWPSELPDGFDFKDLNIGITVPLAIGPKGDGAASMVVPINMLQAQRQLSSRLYVWGWAVYKDVFKGDPDRLTEFCTEIIQVAIPPTKTLDDPEAAISWNLSQCKHNNCYDENCTDYSSRIKQARTPN